MYISIGSKSMFHQYFCMRHSHIYTHKTTTTTTTTSIHDHL